VNGVPKLTGKGTTLQSFSMIARATDTPKRTIPPIIPTNHPTLSHRSKETLSYFLKSSIISSASSELRPLSAPFSFEDGRGRMEEANAERMTSDSNFERSESDVGETRFDDRTEVSGLGLKKR
jgi:hypothetical protein